MYYYKVEEYRKLESIFGPDNSLMIYDNLLTSLTSSLYCEGLDDNYLGIIEDVLGHLNDMYKIALYDHEDVERKNSINKLFGNDSSLEKIVKVKKEYLDKIVELIDGFLFIRRLINSYRQPHSLKDVLLQVCSLTHLVYTNSKGEKIKTYSTDSFMFLCQHHLERTPSFGVINHARFAHCFGCGHNMNVISYIMEIENLDYSHAVQLLSKVYFIDLDFNSYEDDDPLVIKYRSSLTKPEFTELLMRGYNRTKSRDVTWKEIIALETYERDLSTIDRITRKESISFNDIISKDKRIKLEMPF